MTDENKGRRRGGLTTLFFVLFGASILFFATPFGPGVRFFRNPSGSMQPTLEVGDHFMITKWTYGYGRYSFAPFPGPAQRILGRAPQRGEVAVFRPEPEPDRDFVKRVVGLPGDRIQMMGGRLHINGEPVPREDVGLVDFTNEYGEVEQVQGSAKRYRAG